MDGELRICVKGIVGQTIVQFWFAIYSSVMQVQICRSSIIEFTVLRCSFCSCKTVFRRSQRWMAVVPLHIWQQKIFVIALYPHRTLYPIQNHHIVLIHRKREHNGKGCTFRCNIRAVQKKGSMNMLCMRTLVDWQR